MNHIFFKLHLILHSKYNLLINLFIFGLIYTCFYSQQIIYCMTEGNIPEIAETKSAQSNIQEIIHREVYSYLEPAKEIERLTNALAEQQAKAQNAYDAAGRFQNDYRNAMASNQELLLENKLLTEENKALLSEAKGLHDQIEIYDAEQTRLRNKVNDQKHIINKYKIKRK